MRRCTLLLAGSLAVALLQAGSLAAQDGKPARDSLTRRSMSTVDVAQLGARADSFVVLVQGSPLGYQTTSLTRSADGFAYRTSLQIGPLVQQTMETRFGADLTPLSVKGSGAVQGVTVGVEVAYSGGRVKGSSTLPTAAGMKTTSVDTVVARGTLDDNMIGALVPGLDWKAGASFAAPSMDVSTGATREITLTVTGTESMTVPAGTFQVFRILRGGQEPALTLYVTTTAPHRIVKIAPEGAPVEFVLAK